MYIAAHLGEEINKHGERMRVRFFFHFTSVFQPIIVNEILREISSDKSRIIAANFTFRTCFKFLIVEL
jgi:hypothetical protein